MKPAFWGKIACAMLIFLLAFNVLNGGPDISKSLLFHHVTQEDNKRESSLDVKKSLQLVSYNLWCDFFKPHALYDVSERIESLVEGIKDFDIALIQEAYILNTGVVVVSKCASLLIEEMEKHGFYYRTSIADFVAPYVGKSGGIVIFSRVPLLRTASRLYHNYSITQFTDYRGFVVGEYFFNSQHLYVINTHLDPHGVKARILQAKELAGAMENLNSGSHFVVAGDFNIDNNYPTTSNSSEEYRELQQTMNQAGLQSVFPVRLPTNTDGGNYDAMFTSSNVAVIKKQILKLVTKSEKLVSDHFGLAVQLELV